MWIWPFLCTNKREGTGEDSSIFSSLMCKLCKSTKSSRTASLNGRCGWIVLSSTVCVCVCALSPLSQLDVDLCQNQSETLPLNLSACKECTESSKSNEDLLPCDLSSQLALFRLANKAANMQLPAAFFQI